MPLVQQILRICTAALVLGLGLLLIRGVPKPAEASGVSNAHMCTATPSLAPEVTPWIEPSAARALLGDPAVAFVDCRPAEQFQAGHISGALSLPSDGDLPGAALSLLRGTRTIIAYCDARGGCESSQRLAARLRELGMRDVRILSDGLPAWLTAGYPAESGPCRLCAESRTESQP
jgi:rhodanese-related sulfurtransferase